MRVLVGQGDPVGVDRVGEVIAEAARAVEVVPGHHVTPAREHFRVPAPLHGVGDAVVRAAMQQHQRRVLLRRVEARWIDDPHLDVGILRALVGDAFHLALVEARQRRVIEGGQLGGGAGARRQRHQRGRLREALANGHQALAVADSASELKLEPLVTAAGTPPSSRKRYTRRVPASSMAPNKVRESRSQTRPSTLRSQFSVTPTVVPAARSKIMSRERSA